jgi:hypothetical protein
MQEHTCTCSLCHGRGLQVTGVYTVRCIGQQRELLHTTSTLLIDCVRLRMIRLPREGRVDCANTGRYFQFLPSMQKGG